MTPYYEHAGITIYHGDCREILPELSADAIVTDPPYGIGFAAQPTTGQRKRGQQPEAWDDVAPDVSFLLGASRIIAIWGGNYFSLPISRGWLSWYKPDAPPSMGTVEFCWTNRDRCARQIQWSIGATNGERVGHPTQKPEAGSLPCAPPRCLSTPSRSLHCRWGGPRRCRCPALLGSLAGSSGGAGCAAQLAECGQSRLAS